MGKVRGNHAEGDGKDWESREDQEHVDKHQLERKKTGTVKQINKQTKK